MKKLTLFLAVVLAIGCKAQIETKGSKSESQQSGEQKKSNVEYRILAKHEHSKADKKTFEVIRSQKQFDEYASMLELEAMPKVDFENKLVVILFLGQKNTGGYGIDVGHITKDGYHLHIVTKETRPSGMATMAITSPYCIVEVPGIDNITVEF